MYEDHPNFSPPEPGAVLWRYMDFTKFVSLLDTQSLYLARADQLSDPFEGSFPALNVALRPHRYPRRICSKDTFRYSEHSRDDVHKLLA